jgi:phosphoglycerate dehydrogenase-like enzyme
MKIVFAEPIGLTSDQKTDFSARIIKLGHTVCYFDDVPKNQEDLLQRAHDANILIVSNFPVSKEVVEGAKVLEHISVAFTGIDHISQNECVKKGISISNAAGYSTQAVAELTIGMTIDLLRKITPADSVTRSLGGRNGFLGNELLNKTFGILGMGLIGQRVAQLANAFGCKVIAWSRTNKQISGIDFLEFDEVINRSDILSIHLPLTPQTNHLIGIREFEMMKPNSILINTARANIVNTLALVDALKQQLIAGAAVDIYEKEPPLENNHPLFSAPNTLMLPHIGFATHEAIALRSEIVLGNIMGWIEGKPQNIVKID